MKIYYVNRQDREDRNYLFRGAMAAMGFSAEDLVRVIAKNREDYPDRDALCTAAGEDGFGGFFERVRHSDFPGYGCLVATWSCMRAWRTIAESGETSIFMLDDYYIKQPKEALDLLIAPLDDFTIVQLAWHIRDDVFFLDQYNLGIPYQHVAEEVSDKSPYFLKGTWHGCSDWCWVITAAGAQAILDYMHYHSRVQNECVLTAMQHTYRDYPGIYNLRDQPRNVNGNAVLRTNPWVGHLIEYTEGPVSNLMGTHLIDNMKPESELWDERMENPHG